jgi:GR25 family glycosyltransferase involved in LPS biosynthesis
MSHLKILQQAIKEGWPHVAIIEDDTLFLDPGLFVTQLNQFLKTHDTWDVVLMAGNNLPPFERIDDTCVRVSHCQTTTAYIVNGHYMETLANNIKEGIQKLMREPEKHIIYAIDKYWLQLQKKGFWFLITPLTVVQREDYSDIEKKVTKYGGMMTDLEKRHFKPNVLRRII